MNGLEAIVSGIIDSSVKKATGVPGYPITDLMEALGDNNIRHEWSINEKVALEMALGSSVCGKRCAVITKHVGMNILSDPLVTSAIHTIGAGVVIFAGDDPGIEKSQNEQDSRFYGSIAEVPVFDPGTTENAYLCVKEAFILSEKVRTPVIIRLTDRLLKSNGNFVRKNEPYQSKKIDKNIWHLTMLGKHQRFHAESYPQMCKYAETSKLNTYKENKKKSDIGIISSGFPSSLVDSIISDDISHLSLTVVNPLPIDLIDRFIKEHSRVLIIEETEPVIEKQFSKRVFGKLTGHMRYGIAEVEDIQRAIENINNDAVKRDIVSQTIEKRGPRPMCEDCPYMPLYFAIKELDVPVAGDLGCSIMTSSPPLSLIDAAFSLGSSISTACGFNRKGIAIIGDFGLAHSGIPALINAVHNEHEVVVVILQNEVAAMTGGQKVPDLTGLLSYYIKDTVTVNPDEKNIRKILNEKLEKNGVSVILAPAKCPRY
ncbi:MAG: indolepyruvate ferredoxin oxidoreductase subunit alpha [Candidatus Methanoperedens nitroreducens]|uniref:Indolepyruvate oxidoreductase subunit IorA n=1 Tax=Candidatus Methanoperedens nitratireducens TaxID=1392998 RepID=A0A0P8AK49_9EURY|nr:thiamine pyrophosphate-dependent enzyme [Candidatus Methanoperedens sp. BLZ2]KAB2948053.1 MAG: indolepyruvate ferredoxin oxidoreductase subunit alpha [Candidatus Methanoperedens sp.]KPQ45145.1 MAG: indolepyruvate ferredoxin oxidoreductase subunit alpha [Candidatus Methanoperedens sp. BLZ1]MBZ0174584.1 indolepyruvate ferredoxin oxidoreductase subunit alpha [Candidatus Methanoperedens nitroreducens]MCX9076956.1 thiamine pyrophosphate-dependent enzyme [Candidatus Methanoperedens sp.]